MTPDETRIHDQFLRSYTAHEPAIRAYIRRQVPSRADADDVMQDVSVVLWKKFGEFREGADFRSWAFGVARYEVLAWFRDKGRDRLVLDEDVVAKLAVDSEEKENQLSQQREALELCMEKVEPKQRDLLMEAYQPESRIREIAKRSGRTVAGFYQWLHRMRGNLLDCIRHSISTEEAAS